MASSLAPSSKRGRKKNLAQAFFIPLEEEESHDRVPLIQHQQTLDKHFVFKHLFISVDQQVNEAEL